MPERHRSNPRDFDRDRGRGYGGRGDFGGPGGDRGGRGGPGNNRPGPPPRGDRPPYDPQAMHRDNRPPAPPEEMDEFEDVEAQLAVAIIQAATKLTEIVGATGLPESYTERREAVVESFETIYFALLDAITGSDDEEEDEGE